MSSVVKLLRDLIALPSVNPAFAGVDDPWTGEQRVGEYLLGLAARDRLPAERQPVARGRANILVRLAPAGRRATQRVLLAPHMDTVTVEDRRQLDPVVRGGRIHGRGACDTKGSVAAMFTALARVARQRHRPRETEIILAALVDEENGQAGSRALVARGLKADLAIVGEPTLLKVVTAHKGDLWLRIETRGRAAHSSQPELGRNAIAEMARVVGLLEGDYSRSLRRRRHPLLGSGTVNVGTIEGGRQPNIVPDHCEIRVDRRTLPGESDAAIRREIRSLLRRAGCKASIEDWKGLPSVAMETSPRLPLVRGLMSLAGQRRPMGVHYFSDAGVLGQGGIPSVVFGPGDIAQAHTRDEWISVVQLDRGADVLTRFLEGLP
jgi:acetylornithine deacetylase/succinyl-diaminopimelate desuccinylase-like protein